jgi:hypothetical protein
MADSEKTEERSLKTPRPNSKPKSKNQLAQNAAQHVCTKMDYDIWQTAKQSSVGYAETAATASAKTASTVPTSSQHVQKIHTLILNSPEALPSKCQGSREASSRASTSLGKLVQTLATVESQNEKRAAGAAEKLKIIE